MSQENRPIDRPEDEVESLFHLAGRRPKLPEPRSGADQARRPGKPGTATCAAGPGGGPARPAWPSPPDCCWPSGWRSASAPTPRPLAPLGRLEIEAGEVVVSESQGERQVLTAGSVITTGTGGRAALRLAGRALGADRRLLGECASNPSASSPSSAAAPTWTRGPLPRAPRRSRSRHPWAWSVTWGLSSRFACLPSRRGPGSKEGDAVALRVRVREGTVVVDRGGRAYEARAGGELCCARTERQSATRRPSKARSGTGSSGRPRRSTSKAPPSPSSSTGCRGRRGCRGGFPTRRWSGPPRASCCTDRSPG